jgi:hypothetical protein
MIWKGLFPAGMVILAALFCLAGCGDDEAVPPGENPTASTLTVQAEGLSPAISASWTQCPDDDFEEYRLYRDTETGIEEDPDGATLVTVADSVGDTTYRDDGLGYEATYYYALRTTDTEGLHAWSNEASATTPDSSGCLYMTCYQVQGQQSSSPYEGEVVTVMAIVTATADDFYMGDTGLLGDPGGGPWTGLAYYDSTLSLSRGDSVMVTGTVKEHYGFTELIDLSEVTVLGTGASIPPATQVETVDISDMGSDPEQWECVLVEIRDAVVQSIGQYGMYDVDDGSGECIVDDDGNYSYSPSVGDTLYSAVGIVWYSFDEWQLEPRDDSDIDVGGGDVHTCYQPAGFLPLRGRGGLGNRDSNRRGRRVLLQLRRVRRYPRRRRHGMERAGSLRQHGGQRIPRRQPDGHRNGAGILRHDRALLPWRGHRTFFRPCHSGGHRGFHGRPGGRGEVGRRAG